ncbi:MAG: carboxypeptidase-like regulatory domain-containing protein [Chloroflexota bacterium]
MARFHSLLNRRLFGRLASKHGAVENPARRSVHTSTYRSVCVVSILIQCIFIAGICIWWGVAQPLQAVPNQQTSPTVPTPTPPPLHPDEFYPPDYHTCDGNGAIQGIVLQPDGQPAAGAYVSVYLMGGYWYPCGDPVESDETGAFTLSGLHVEDWIVRADPAWSENELIFSSQEVIVAVGDGETVQLSDPLQLQGPQLSGNILLPDGSPAAWASGRIRKVTDSDCTVDDRGHDPYYGWGYELYFSTTEQGLWGLADVEAGSYCLFLDPLMPYNLETGHSEGTILNPPAPFYFEFDPANAPVDLGSIQFTLPAKRIEGAVVDQNGVGIANATVEANNYYHYGWVSTTTDTDGKYVLQVNGGEWHINAYLSSDMMGAYPEPGSEQIVRFADNDEPETQTADFSLEVPTSTLTGRIVDASGNPVSGENGGVYITIEGRSSSIDGPGYHSAHVNPNAEGLFSVRLFAGTYKVVVGIDMYMFPGLFGSTLTDIEVAADQVVELGDIALAGPQVQGTVVRPNGQPVSGASFEVITKHGENCNLRATHPEPVYYDNGPWGDFYYYGYANENGVILMGGLVADDYCLSVHPPYDESGLIAPDPVPFTIEDDSDLIELGTLSLRVPPKEINGYVKSESGEGIADAYVSAYGIDSYSPSWYGAFGDTTDADGYFSFKVGGGTWEVTTYPTDYDSFWSEYNYKTVRFAQDDTPETQTISFTVKSADATVKGRIVDPDGEPVGGYGLWIDLSNEDGYSSGVEVRRDGTFEVAVISGNYQMYINLDPGYHPELYVGEQPIIQVTAGETVDLQDIQLSRKSAVISGTVLDEEGQPISDAVVNAWSYNGDWGYATTSSDGSYSLRVREGHFEVAVSQDAYPPTWFVLDPPQQVEAKDEQTQTVDFTVYGPAGTIYGSLVNVDGNVLTDVGATAYARRTSSGGYGYFDVAVDARVVNGRFEMKVPQGAYQVGVYLDYHGDYSFFNEESAEIESMSTLLSLNNSVNRAGIQAASVQAMGESIQLVGEQQVTISGQSVRASQVSAAWVETSKASQNAINSLEDAEVQIVLKRNDAIISGQLLDPDGSVVTGIYGEVSAWTDRYDYGGWGYGPIDSTSGSYEMRVADGIWQLGYWIDTQEYLPNASEPISVTAVSQETTVQNITLQPLNGVIEGTVLDTNGDPLAYGYAWANVENDGTYYHSTGAEVVNGQFTLKVLTGVEYSVGVDGGYWGPSTGQAKVQRVTVAEGTPAQVALQLRLPDSKIQGTITQGETGETTPFAYVSAWSDNGEHAYGEADANGNFSLDVLSGSVWHLSASWYPGTGPGYYETRSDLDVDLTNAATVSVNPQVYLALSSLPPALVDSFDTDTVWTASLDDGTRIDIPAGAMPVTNEQGDDVTITVTPLVEDLPDTYVARPIDYGYGIHLYEYRTGKRIEGNFNTDATLTFYYTDDELAALGITEEEIAPAYYSTTDNAWRQIENFTVTTEENRITAQVNHFSNWALVVPGSRTVSTRSTEPAIFLPMLTGGN